MSQDIYARIKADHDHARELMEKIVDTNNSAEKTRRRLFDEFKIDIWTHHKVEEATFYAQLRKEGEDEEAFEAYNEHHMANNLVEELATMAMMNDPWLQKFKTLKELLEHHMEEEEEEFFEIARKEIDPARAEALGQWFDERKRAAAEAITPI